MQYSDLPPLMRSCSRSPSGPSGVAAFLLATLVTALLPIPGDLAAQLPELKLYETGRWAVPDDFVIAGATGGPDGMMSVWSDERVLVLDSTLAVVSSIQVPATTGSYWVGVRSRGIELLSSESSEIRTLDYSGAALGTVSLDLPGPVRHATHSDGSWYVVAGLHPDSTENVILEIRPDRSIERIARTHVQGLLSVGSDRVFLARTSRPHGTEIVAGEDAGHVLRPKEGLIDSLTIATRGRSPDNWVALPMLDVGRAFVQSFADLSSDWRVVVVYDRDGSPARSQIYRVPIGLVASDGDRETLLSVLRLNRPEIVRYRWGWEPK